jgi:hypothetical protein
MMILVVLLPGPGHAWDNFVSHESLADRAIQAIALDPKVARHLNENLQLSKSTEEPLALQLGFAPTIDADIAPQDPAFTPPICAGIHGSWEKSRLTDNLNWLEDDPASPRFPSSEIGVVLNPACPYDEDHATCVEELCRYSVQTWIELGTFAEDNENARAQHHFHDPVKVHSPPTGNHGMDDRIPLLFGLDAVIADAAAAAFRGGSWSRFFASLLGRVAWWSTERDPGNFDLRGLSAVDRALNTPRDAFPASEEIPKNLFALPDAERYLYSAITARYADERESFTALHFLALGHVLHLLQDMGSVAHTRNDFLVDHALDVLRIELNLEGAPREASGTTNVARSVLSSISGDQSVPYQKLLAYAGTPAGVGLDISSFTPLLGLETIDVLRRREVNDLFDEAPFTDPSGRGLAEYVNTHFFSVGTIDNDVGEDGYLLPPFPGCGDVGDSAGAGAERVSVVELPERDRVTGEIKTGSERAFLSSPAVPHLASCRFHSREFLDLAPKFVSDWGATVIDESVQRDYLELIWPRVIRTTAAFLASQLSPRLEVLPESPTSFRLSNASLFDLRFDPAAVEIAYDTLDAETELPRRVVIPVLCDAASSQETLPAAANPDELGEASEFVCELPEALEEPALIRDSFWILVRGALGQRGEVGTLAEFEAGAKEAVVAIRRVGPAVVIDHLTTGTDDESEQVDLLRIAVDPQNDFALGAPENLTAGIRTALGDQIDVSFPALIPGTGLLAVRSDETVPSDQAQPLFLTGTLTDLYLFNRAGVPVTRDVYAGPAPDSRYDGLTFHSARATATPSGSLLFAPAEVGGAGARLRAYARPPIEEFSSISSKPVTSRGALTILGMPTSDTVQMERCGEPKRLLPISESEAFVTAECSHRTWNVTSQTLGGVERSADSVFRATLVDQGSELEAVYIHVLDAHSTGTARGLVACGPDIPDPALPGAANERPSCPSSAASIQRIGSARIESGQVTAVSFLHNLNPQFNAVPGPTSDVSYLDLSDGSVHDVAVDLPNTVSPESAWSPGGSTLAFFDTGTHLLSFVDVSDPMALPAVPVTPAPAPQPPPPQEPQPLPTVAASFTWDAGLILPSN